MWNWKLKSTASALLALGTFSALSLTAISCGQADPTVINDGDMGGSQGGSFGGDTTIDPSLQPNYAWHFKITGSGTAAATNGAALKVQTDTTIKVRIQAGDGLPMQPGGYSIGFNCELFRVTVGTVTKTAFVKKQSYQSVQNDPCVGASTTWASDFSNTLAPGHGDVSIKINGAMYDNCRLQGGYGPYYGGCGPLTTVYSTHPVDGKLDVFTN